jgi:large subunit ribosomal protein L6
MTSRIGKLPIDIPEGVTVNLSGNHVDVKGPKGSLSFDVPELVKPNIDGSVFTVEPQDETKQAGALHGLSRSLVANMIQGVKDGFEKKLEIVGIGYRAVPKGTKIELSLGFSHPVEVEAPEGIQLTVEGANIIVVSGIDKQQVGETAAKIRKIRPPEPYKGKGIRYVGERIKLKAGKAGK